MHAATLAVVSGALATNLCGIALRNPVILAAGTCGVIDEMAGVLDLSRIGAVTTKSITRLPREGNETWRVYPCRSGMLNAIGLANPGLDAFVEHYLPRAKTMPCPVIASVAGFSVEDYVAVAGNLDEHAGPGRPLAAIELNVSCPNVKTGTEFGSSPALVRELVSAVRPVVRTAPIFVKLGPMTPELPLVARAAATAGANALTIANTVPAMMIDVHTRRPVLANITGGLSGPAVHPVAVKLVYDVYRLVARETGTPIIGAGGVMRWKDAAEFILAGATAVQMGTALFADPRAPYRVSRGLAKWAARQGRDVSALVGALDTESRTRVLPG